MNTAVLESIDFSQRIDERLRKVPTVDGFKAEQIRIRFVGVVDLDSTSADDLAFVEALKLGAPVRAVVTGAVSGKGFTHKAKSELDEEIGYYAYVKIDNVEVGEAA